ncbi:MAG: monovalent cation/H+ antiporter subunit D family protein [Proteobacteria bacterium]|nr:monovalent cation/H+ antiporter subunit D family protein [Pseudomonadota bacterium]MBU1639637.1 monovalent cation/H+ antiporter subunit D family protein [Pseudomonadota bacterium]
MIWHDWLLVMILLSSLGPGLIIFSLAESSRASRTTLNIFGAVTKMVLVLVMILGIYRGHSFAVHFTILPGLELVLRADPLSALFVTLSSILWLFTTLYAIAYLEDSPNRSHFFGYFSLCVTVTIGIALAGNLLTFLFFFEMLTLSTYPLVVHRGTAEAMAAGKVYLVYTLAGGILLFIGVVWLHAMAGPVDFSRPGLLTPLVAGHGTTLKIIFYLLLAGVGVKAALFPLHGWLPRAMVAPAPVSALLHAVAVVKAGAFGIIRIVLDVYGLDTARTLGLLLPLMLLSSITIMYGSVRALSQDNLKRRLAFSTVSQVSYIALGISIGSPLAIMGGMVHLVHQGLMKITLFFCAGNIAETLGIHDISRMNGVGRRLPVTMAAFTLAAMGMIGLPPMAGFVSKWYLGLGALAQGQGWIVWVLVLSSLLNGAYFLPILYGAWFKEQEGEWPADSGTVGSLESHWMLIVPPVITAVVSLLVGLLANSSLSPLAWVRFIVRTGYGL